MNTEAALAFVNLITLAIRVMPIFVCLKPKHSQYENIAAVSVYVWVLMISAQSLFQMPDLTFWIFQGVFSALFFLILLIFFEGAFSLKIFLYFSAWFFSALLSSLNAFAGFVLQRQSTLRYEHICLILAIAMFFLYYLLVKYYLKDQILRLFDQLNTRSSALIMALPIVFLILLVFGRNSIFPEGRLLEEGMPTILFYLAVCTMMFLLYLLAVGDTLRTVNQRTTEEKLKAARQIIDLKKENYNQILEHQEEIRIIRHDFSHHIHALQHMKEADRQAYLTDLQAELNRGKELVFCDNHSVNSLLQDLSGRAKADKTRFQADLALASELPVDDLTLCVILGNLLENALDACRKCEHDRFIRLQMRSEDDALRIMVQNRYNGIVRRRDNLLLSTKMNGGLGMLSVRRLLDHPEDDLDYYYDGTTFTSMVYLAARKEAGPKRPEGDVI